MSDARPGQYGPVSTDSELLAAALCLARELGGAITLCRQDNGTGSNRGKSPIPDEWQHKRYTPDEVQREFARHGELNVGIIWGPESGLIDIEADSPEQEQECARLFDGCDPPVTASFASRRGKHRLFAWHDELAVCGKAVVSFGKSKLGIRIGCCKGAHSLIPPSLNSDGTRREWLVSMDDCPPAELPAIVRQRIIEAAKAGKGVSENSDKPPRHTHSGTNGHADAAVAAMLGLDMADQNDGSSRLFAYCCRGVEHDLNDGDILAAVRTAERTKPFPRSWLDSDILARVRDAERTTQRGTALRDSDQGAIGSGKRESQSARLICLASSAELWHDPASDGWATIDVDGHCEHWSIRSRGFKRWLAKRYYDECGGAAGAQAVQDALGVIEAKAIHDGKHYATALRVGGDDTTIYIDLCDAQWQAIEVTAGGWRVVADPSIRFRRARAMLPLPMPVAGGSVDELRQFINARDDDWPTTLGWLVAALRPRGPYPLLHPAGEAGSGKSTRAMMLRSLVDPNLAPLRSEPREPRDLAIAANNGWVVALDNVSWLPPWLSDALCRLSTGGGFSTRTLYENDEETIFFATRPAIVTGIEVVAERGDLLDRALLVNLLPIPEHRRLPESVLWARFEEARPRILGALLTAVSCALRRAPDVRLDRLPRMADFAIWATAAEPAIGLADGAVIDAYAASRAQAHETAIEASPIGGYIAVIAADLGGWTGTASDLLAELERRAEHDGKRRPPKGWPASAKALSDQLRRLAPNLRASGITVEFARTGRRGARMIRFGKEQIGNSASVASASSAAGEFRSEATDEAPGDQEPFASADRFASAVASAVNPENVEENGSADATDDADARIPARSDTDRPACNHLDPAVWVHRDGAAWCPGCNRWMGNVRKGR